jgi:hypothetical protein
MSIFANLGSGLIQARSLSLNGCGHHIDNHGLPAGFEAFVVRLCQNGTPVFEVDNSLVSDASVDMIRLGLVNTSFVERGGVSVRR